MFLNILRISASNVLKMFLNIMLVLVVHLLISIRTNLREVQTNRKYKYAFFELAAALADKTENVITNEKYLKQTCR